MLSALDAEMRGDRKEMEKLARQAPIAGRSMVLGSNRSPNKNSTNI